MKYAGMPMGMWVLFAGSFQKQLTAVLGYDAATAKAITKKAKPQYRQIICRLPEFEKADRFKMNIVNCAMLGAFILSMPQRPEVDRLTDYYAKAMMTKPMQWFCRKSGKSKFTSKDIAAMKATAALKAADRNPYSWNMEFYEYPDGSGYEGRFTKCGICVLMKELGLYDLTPALCHLDYTMSEAGGVTNFVRQYTLASGGPYCDCGYKKKKKILAFFKKLGLSDKLNVKTGKLSFGQQQRVAFIRALCQPFDFLFLDEPISHLDDDNSRIMGELIIGEAEKQQAGVIATSIGKHIELPYQRILQL